MSTDIALIEPSDGVPLKWLGHAIGWGVTGAILYYGDDVGVDDGTIPLAIPKEEEDDDNRLITFYRGVGYYNGLEIVQNQSFNIKKIQADQKLNSNIEPGLYLAHDPIIANYWASTYSHAGGETVLTMQVRLKRWNELVAKYPSIIQLRISQDMNRPLNGVPYLETVIPYPAIQEFTNLTKETGGIKMLP